MVWKKKSYNAVTFVNLIVNHGEKSYDITEQACKIKKLKISVNL